MANENIEKIDNITNAVMDYLREQYQIDPDSEWDDTLYTKIHAIVEKEVNDNGK